MNEHLDERILKGASRQSCPLVPLPRLLSSYGKHAIGNRAIIGEAGNFTFV